MKRVTLLSIAFFLVFASAGCGCRDVEAEVNETASTSNAEQTSSAENTSEFERTTYERESETATNIPVDIETTNTPSRTTTTQIQTQTSATIPQWLNEDVHVYEGEVLVFSSLEQLIETHKMAREGHTVGNIAFAGEFAYFAELEKLYMPKVVPNDYLLYKIETGKTGANFYFLHKKHLVSDDAILKARIQHEEFHFGYSLWDSDFPMEGIMQQHNATEVDLIEGKYLFTDSRRFDWALGRDSAYVYVPLSLCDGSNKFAKMIKYTEVKVVDLR